MKQVSFAVPGLPMGHARPSWLLLILSVYLPRGGYDEENYVATLGVRIITEEGTATGAKDFIGGDINIELKLGAGSDEFEGLDSIGWYGLHGPACRGGGEDEVTCDKKIRWLQQVNDFNCTVTGPWVDAHDPGDCHTWRGWGSRVCKK